MTRKIKLALCAAVLTLSATPSQAQVNYCPRHMGCFPDAFGQCICWT